MGYKDQQEQREYQTRWARSHKPSPEYKRTTQHRYRERRRLIVDEILGSACKLCGGTYRLQAHQIDMVPHEDFLSMSKTQARELLGTGRFVRLCYRCHMGVHWSAEVLGVNPIA
jgi:hypothetical protein